MGETTMFLGSLLLRGSLLLLLALVATTVLRRRSAAMRHHIWVLAGVGALLLPGLGAMLPDWTLEVPILEAPAAEIGMANADLEAPVERSLAVGRANELGSQGSMTRSAANERESLSAAAGASVPSEAEFPWAAALSWLWLVGFVILAGRLLIGIFAASRIARSASPVEDRRWRVLVGRLSLQAGLTRHVQVVQSDRVDVPMAWGMFDDWLILPVGMDRWSEERRRVVVLHELAHLRRRDCLAQAVVSLAVAIHWPNPLAWLALARLKAERELACDDSVLQAGTRGHTYAQHLVAVARDLRRPRPDLRAAVAMARVSDLEERVAAILDSGRSRDAVGKRTARLGLLSAVVLVVPLGVLRPVPVVERAPPTADQLLVEDMTTDSGEAGLVEGADEGELQAGTQPAKQRATQPITGSPATENVSLEYELEAGSVQADTIEEKVYRALVKALQSENPNARRSAAHTFGQIESDQGVPPLLAALNDPVASVREKVAWALGMIESDEAVDALVRTLQDDDPEVRETTVWALGMIESPAAVPGLARMLTDADPDVREQAAWSLGMIESEDAVSPLLPLLRDDNEEVREQAAWALGMIESNGAVEGLASAFHSEDSADVREQIVWALGMIEDRAALDVVIDAIEDPDTEVSDQALWALGMIMS